jgi:hypothetical protein
MDLTNYPQDVQTLAGEARKLVRHSLARAKEGEDPAARSFAYTYGPGYKGVVCTLLLSKAGVKLGIVGGASLPDPHKLMRGEGRIHRHVPLQVTEDLHKPGIKELLQAASDACDKRLADALSMK